MVMVVAVEPEHLGRVHGSVVMGVLVFLVEAEVEPTPRVPITQLVAMVEMD
jgi:hypothetical protein